MGAVVEGAVRGQHEAGPVDLGLGEQQPRRDHEVQRVPAEGAEQRQPEAFGQEQRRPRHLRGLRRPAARRRPGARLRPATRRPGGGRSGGAGDEDAGAARVHDPAQQRVQAPVGGLGRGGDDDQLVGGDGLGGSRVGDGPDGAYRRVEPGRPGEHPHPAAPLGQRQQPAHAGHPGTSGRSPRSSRTGSESSP
ncbi:hypothetical protein [[Actinomadura] parvosata]|uniref:hypothetical protein n=1 Tax=[Actinomadura] parvosata TaxID=1955412 RepID=UPI001E39D42E|nr:hypothetical protein [Nonomuraea sp. ATCC 55076]